MHPEEGTAEHYDLKVVTDWKDLLKRASAPDKDDNMDRLKANTEITQRVIKRELAKNQAIKQLQESAYALDNIKCEERSERKKVLEMERNAK